ncbi:MAG: hypothetical protein LBB93_00700 [Elusimicrobiota bacterium]|jgi:hypothetical protein|nr:hypothetical protein [Elusimicrobiota bacterium]
MKKIIFTAFFVLMAFATFSFAQEKISTTFNKTNALVGDIIEMVVTVELEQEAYVSSKQNLSFNNFDIRNITVRHLSISPNIFELVLEIAAYKTGELAIEPTVVFYINSDGTNNLFFTPYQTFSIVSSINDNKAQIRDLKPPRKLSIEPFYFVLMILIILIIASLAFLIYKDFSEPKKVETPVDPQTAALNSLNELYQTDMKNIDSRLFYYVMSGILREYISLKYNCNAMEMTTREFFESIKKILPHNIDEKEVAKYLKLFNIVRYAAFEPGYEENEKSYAFTKMLLETL